jgi:cytochrome c5
MKRTISFVIVAVLAAAVMPMLSNAFGEEKAQQLDGKSLFEQKCLKCHKKPKFQDLTSDRKGWVLTLSRMQRGTCTISDAELEVLADYLAENFGE